MAMRLVVVAWALAGLVLGCNELAAMEGDRIEAQVAEDAVRQYEIARRGGDAAEICVHAGLVAAAYLQAEDGPNHRKWKAIERADCEAAGMPK